MNNLLQITEGEKNHNTLSSDFKAEIVALNILKYYDNVDHVFLKRLGGNNRPFNKDVESVKAQEYELDELVVTLTSYREGIYDYLPEGVFHPPSLGDYRSSVDEIIAQIQKQKKIEKDARNFFQPFELECFFLEINALSKENEFELINQSNLFLSITKELWPLLNSLDQETSKVFIYLLPFFYKVKGDKEWLRKCLVALLQIPVEINYVANRVSEIKATSDTVSLSNFHLGISMVLCGEHFDGERNWAINYGPIPYEDISKFVPKSSLRKLLETLYDYFIPATIEIEEHFVVNKNESSFWLNQDLDTSRLGFSTFL